MSDGLFLLNFINEYFLIGYALLAGYVIYYFDKKRLLDYVIAIALAGLLTEGIKYIVNEPRPVPLNENFVFEGSSFPSSHTAIAFAIYFFYLFCVTINRNKFDKVLRLLGIKKNSAGNNDILEGKDLFELTGHMKTLNMLAIVAFLLLSVIVAYLRFYTRAHFFIDIFAGIIVGFFAALPFVYYDITGRRIK